MFSPHYAVALAVAFLWTALFSLTNRPIRVFRNLGLLACYIIGIVMLFRAGLKQGLATWALFGLAGGLLYVIYDIVAYVRAKPDEKQSVSFSHLLNGLLAWPLMAPEAVENILAEIGVLKTPPLPEPPAAGDAEQSPADNVEAQPAESDGA